MSSREVVIVSAARTPIGSFGGSLASVTAPQLGATAIAGVVARAKLDPAEIDEVFMGCVLSAGQGQAPARQAMLGAKVPQQVGAVTLNKVCGSGLKAVMMAAAAIKAGDANVMVAGGMESMSNAPYYLPKARQGYRMGHGQVIDGMIHDGLWDPYNNFHMGSAGELCARERKIDRARQDAFAARSYQRAQAAVNDGAFAAEVVPVDVEGRRGDVTRCERDEEPFRGDIEKLGRLRPAFAADGTITAGNASTLNDGAAALLLLGGDEAMRRGLKPLAKIVGYAGAAGAPEWFTTAPVKAIQNLFKKTGHRVSDVDLWEVNEAFSVVALVTQDDLGIPDDRLNVRGGAVALGHPIGASGARILTTLIYALQSAGKRRGVAALCLGGGEAVALMVEVG